MSEKNNIRDAADAIKGIVEAVPVYQDVVQPAAKEIGTALQTVSKTLHILLAPVSGLVWGYDKIKEFVSTTVAEKLENVPVERLQSPEPNIAGPALEALKYTGYHGALREMYANLLATTIDSSTAENAHPAFVEIIKQMSPDEALIMRLLSQIHSAPYVDVRKERKNSNVGYWGIKHFSLLPYICECQHAQMGPNYLVNLQRLGLVEIRENYTLQPEGLDPYIDLQNHPSVATLVDEINSEAEYKANVQKGAIQLTPLGEQFCSACVDDDTHHW